MGSFWMGGGHRGFARRHISKGDGVYDKHRIWLDINSKEIQSLMELICTFKPSHPFSLSHISFSRKLFKTQTIYYGFVWCHVRLPSTEESLLPFVGFGILIPPAPHHDYGCRHLSSTPADGIFVWKSPVQMDYSCQGLLLAYGIDTSLPTHSSSGMRATFWHG